MKKNLRLLRTSLPFIALGLVFIVFKILQPNRFGTWTSIYAITQQSLMQCILACGVYLLLSMGVFDLTIGANTVVSGMIGTILSNYLGWVGLLSGVLIGIIIATISGQFMIRLNAPPMIISVGLVILYEASTVRLHKIISAGNRLGKQFRAFGVAPTNIILGVVVITITMLILKYSKYGLYNRAIGSSSAISANMGIDIKRYKTYTFILCGLCAGLFGIVNVCYSSTSSAVSGMASATSIFKPIMSCMFASSYKKHLNPIIGLVVGVFFLNLIANGLLTNGLEASLQNVVVGLALIAVVRMSSTSRKYDVVK